MQDLEELPFRPDSHSIASAWAQSVLKDDTVTKPQDRPYMEAVLTTAALMEQPVKSLAVAINDNADHYKITLKGYKQLMDDEAWYMTFRGLNRDEMLDNVRGTYTQHPVEGIVKVIHLNKVQFKTPAPSSSSHRRRSNDDDNDHIYTPAPASSRRFRNKN